MQSLNSDSKYCIEESLKNRKYAGFWRRLLAALLDGIVLIFPIFLLTIHTLIIYVYMRAFILNGEGFELRGGGDIAEVMAWFCISFTIIFLYFTIMESSRLQGTIGKLALRIKVTDSDGDRMNFVGAVIRFLTKYVIFMLAIFCANYIANFFIYEYNDTLDLIAKIIGHIVFILPFALAGLTKNKQALHDIFNKTFVLKKSI